MANVFVPSEIALEDRTVGRILSIRAEEFGEKVFVETTEGDSVTYKQMHEQSNSLAHGLEDFGVGFQETVLVMLPDTIDYLTVWCGLSKRGAVEVPINLAYRKNILVRLCNESGAQKLIVDRSMVQRFEEVAESLNHLNCVILYSEDPQQQGDVFLPPKLAAKCSVHRYEGLFSDNIGNFTDGPTYQDLVGIMFTSGTTGVSKGVATSHSHSFCYADGAGEIFHLISTDRFYTAGLPLFHIGCQWAVCYSSMIYGSTVVLRKGYRNEYFWKDIDEHDCTVVFLLGAIANFLWQQPPNQKDPLTPLKKVGMFPVIPEHQAFCERFEVEISTGYGSTENPCPAIHHFGEPFPNNQCVGFPTGRYEVKIFDEDDCELPRGVMGQICTRAKESWEMLIGYWNQPTSTVDAFRNLWYHTGDAGYMDVEGRLYFVDRLTDSMRRRGENISSMEVEDEINQHRDVLESAVFPVWDENTEQEVMAVIVTQPDTKIDPKLLIKFLEQRMAYFMIPRYIDFASEIPKTPTGKMEKYKLREKGITRTTWDRVAAGVKLAR